MIPNKNCQLNFRRRFKGYKIHHYNGNVNLVCTGEDVNVDEDPVNDWREKFDNDPLRAVASQEFAMKKTTKALKRIQNYFAGVNKEFRVRRPK